MGDFFNIIYLSGFPWLKPKLEFTIIAIQNAIKITRAVMSLHFLLCPMSPPIWVTPSLDGYLPITAPNGPLIFSSLYLYFISSNKLCFNLGYTELTEREVSVAEEMQREEEQGAEQSTV